MASIEKNIAVGEEASKLLFKAIHKLRKTEIDIDIIEMIEEVREEIADYKYEYS